MKNRCVNLDWVQVHVREPICHDADYFRDKGYYVKERDYGTALFEQQFIVYEKDFPYIEIYRKPYSLRQNGGIFEPNDVHLRLSNRACYEWHAIDKLRSFLIAHGYEFKNIVRIDICMDFQLFDGGDNPAVFVSNYMKEQYRKINQPRIDAHGKECWDGRIWNSLKWGSSKSIVTTKLYNKSLELKEVKDKFYIRDAWKAVGMDENERPVWRVEFSLTSQSKLWTKYGESVDEETGEIKWEKQYISNSLCNYDSPERLLTQFHMLADHYFHFKRAVRLANGSWQRKDRCPDKMLFVMNREEQAWKPCRLTENREPDRTTKLLVKRLSEMYKDPHYRDKVHAACQVIARQLRLDMRMDEYTAWLDDISMSYDTDQSAMSANKHKKMHDELWRAIKERNNKNRNVK